MLLRSMMHLFNDFQYMSRPFSNCLCCRSTRSCTKKCPQAKNVHRRHRERVWLARRARWVARRTRTEAQETGVAKIACAPHPYGGTGSGCGLRAAPVRRHKKQVWLRAAPVRRHKERVRLARRTTAPVRRHKQARKEARGANKARGKVHGAPSFRGSPGVGLVPVPHTTPFLQAPSRRPRRSKPRSEHTR